MERLRGLRFCRLTHSPNKPAMVLPAGLGNWFSSPAESINSDTLHTQSLERGNTMSRETAEWLNTMVLVGATDNRGKAWHYREHLQIGESTHYAGFIPADDINRRLFNWEPMEIPLTVNVGGVEIETGSKALIRPPFTFGDDDMGASLGIHGEGYVTHSYRDEGLERLAPLAQDGVGMTAAGLLKGGAVAWVELSALSTWEYGGVTFRPNLLWTSSLDGSHATTCKTVITNTVCDNTLSAAMAENGGEKIRVKHTKNSIAILDERFNAMEYVTALGEKWQAGLDKLLNTEVKAEQVEKFLEVLHPILPDAKTGEAVHPRGLTRRENIRAEYHTLLNSDPRVHPWQGTAWGLLAAHNTYAHHIAPVKGGDDARAARNMTAMVAGDFDKVDTAGMKALELALA